VEKEYDYLHLPLMVKENSIIVTGRDDRPDYDYAMDAEVRIYRLQEGQEVSAIVYDMNGDCDLKITARNQDGEIVLQTAASKPYIVRLINVRDITASGASVRADGNDTIIIPDGGDRIVIRHL
jgi:alpha-glucosidase (family GH31 glycosyl hydrolase)